MCEVFVHDVLIATMLHSILQGMKKEAKEHYEHMKYEAHKDYHQGGY